MRVIAIDGPAGSGKSTVARRLADRLGLEYLDTGAMYRAVAFDALRCNVDPEDGERVASLARDLELDVDNGNVVVDGTDATVEIRGPEVTRAVSIVAANPGVREEMRRRQREWAAKRDGGVIEGRDIGTVVFPDAALKVFLTAAPETRARRRRSRSHNSTTRRLPPTSRDRTRSIRDATTARSPRRMTPSRSTPLIDPSTKWSTSCWRGSTVAAESRDIRVEAARSGGSGPLQHHPVRHPRRCDGARTGRRRGPRTRAEGRVRARARPPLQHRLRAGLARDHAPHALHVQGLAVEEQGARPVRVASSAASR